MSLNRYYSEQNRRVRISRRQASSFAKEVAGDFNPIHNVDAKRFCVPGDLLFALVLHHYGVSERMRFRFEGMVGEDTELRLPPGESMELLIPDATGREYMKVERDGANSRDSALIENLTRAYVSFSGKTFPHILVPLMERHGVMINPDRPLVIYESMSIHLEDLERSDLRLELGNTSLSVDGKRGDVRLEFHLVAGDARVGTGEKTMVLSGLRPFEHAGMQALVEDYEARKQSYLPDGKL